ncbi:MAG TPA: hypothetical protein VFK21_02100, partial [Gammaproteobacteria bacterium]|nr:hypothetical protein [Gammaproteobacteria bacterium]
MTQIKHFLSGIGEVQIPLYESAHILYETLLAKHEITRLNKLRHLGAISPVFNGMRHVRWDYTVSMLYFASNIKCYGSANSINFETSTCSSLNAALQILALAWNIGHLPGTFGTEKGLLRYLKSINPVSPASVLSWPAHDPVYR